MVLHGGRVRLLLDGRHDAIRVHRLQVLSQLSGHWRTERVLPCILSVHCDLLLSAKERGVSLWCRERRTRDVLEITTVLLVNEDEVEVVPGTELLVDVSEGWCEFEAS